MSLTPIAEQEEFSYAPLDPKNRSIRLIRIRPNLLPSGHIRCDIRHARLDHEDYVCLSYVWGPTDSTQWIMVGESLFEVRQNLWDFLNSARQLQRHASMWFWIDALCINQADVSERNHQVQQMGQTYENAQEVVSWLGTDRFIMKLLAYGRYLKPMAFAEACQYFRESRYWTRAWITQEVALARRNTVMADDQEADLRSTTEILHPLYCFEDPLKDSLRPMRDPAQWGDRKGRSLIQLLWEFKGQKCEAYQDKVYSLLALCGEGSDLQVDYRDTRQQPALKILYSCRQSLCLCSFRLITIKLLSLWLGRYWEDSSETERYLQGLLKTQPFVECILPTSALRVDSTGERTVTLRFGDYCTSYEYIIYIQLSSEVDTILDVKWSGKPKDYRFMFDTQARETSELCNSKENYSVILLPDSCVVRFSFRALVDLLELLHGDYRLCPRIHSLGTPAEGHYHSSVLNLCSEYPAFVESSNTL